MKVFLELIKSKIFPWLLLFGTLLFLVFQLKTSNELDTYNRQLSGALTDKERDMQKLNTDLGLAKAQLLTQQELAKRLQEDKEETDKNFQDFIKEHNLQIKSRDKTIAKLKQQINGGTSVVVVPDTEGCKGIEGRCVVSYSWEDLLKRFKLEDPDIFKQNNETFTSNQIFKVYGEVYEQRKGSLEVRRLVLREVYRKPDGSYEPIPDAKANIVDSSFEYSNSPAEQSKQKFFNPRLIAVGSVDYNLDKVTSSFGLGIEALHIKKLSLGVVLAPNFEHLKDTKIMLGIDYTPSLDLNLALGFFVGSPITHLEYTFSLGAIFYITN